MDDPLFEAKKHRQSNKVSNTGSQSQHNKRSNMKIGFNINSRKIITYHGQLIVQ